MRSFERPSLPNQFSSFGKHIRRLGFSSQVPDLNGECRGPHQASFHIAISLHHMLMKRVNGKVLRQRITRLPSQHNSNPQLACSQKDELSFLQMHLPLNTHRASNTNVTQRPYDFLSPHLRNCDSFTTCIPVQRDCRRGHRRCCLGG